MHLEDGLFGSDPTTLETPYTNTLSGSFDYINTLPLPAAGLVGEVEWKIGFLWAPPVAWEKYMDRNGGRFGGAGRFSRGGRENFQYCRKDDGVMVTRIPMLERIGGIGIKVWGAVNFRIDGTSRMILATGKQMPVVVVFLIKEDLLMEGKLT